jgi:hypothetical protein
MNGLRTAVTVTLLSVALLWPRPSNAMDIQQFDKMATQDQRDYIAFLVKEAQKLLIEQGRRDLAVKARELFHNIRPGEQRSAGEAQIEKHLAAARTFSASAKLSGKVSWNRVESALFQVLVNNGIVPPSAFFKAFPQVVRNRVFYQKPV